MSVELRAAGECRWEIPRTGAMRVPGRVYADEREAARLREDPALEQVRNVAHLPGIVGASLAMPDIHWGYGFPIGGVAAVDPDDGGAVSPGGIGYDINCGVRLVATALAADEIKPKARAIVAQLFRDVPTGVGASKAIPALSGKELKRVLRDGAQWAIARGFGNAGDAERCEEGGRLAMADPSLVSGRALERGADQLGTLGSGNHFLELDEVAEILLPEVAERFGLFPGQLCLLIHSGSRGLGYQVCDDALEAMQQAVRKYRIELPDPQLACAPLGSDEGRAYLGAMAAAANFAWANRQTMQGLADRALQHALRAGPADVRARLVYDVCHNIGKFEEHTVDGRKQRLFVHRKGATRAFPAGDARVPADYRDVGQPVIIPGDMGRASYVLVGAEGSMRETWGSSCHGAGRRLSRHAALKAAKGREIFKEMEALGVVVMGKGHKSVAEEIPEAYKDVSEVVSVVERAGLSRIVARLKPFGVIKG